jgi:hypothetical protein
MIALGIVPVLLLGGLVLPFGAAVLPLLIAGGL